MARAPRPGSRPPATSPRPATTVWVLEGVGQGGSERLAGRRDLGELKSFDADVAATQAMIDLVIRPTAAAPAGPARARASAPSSPPAPSRPAPRRPPSSSAPPTAARGQPAGTLVFIGLGQFRAPGGDAWRRDSARRLRRPPHPRPLPRRRHPRLAARQPRPCASAAPASTTKPPSPACRRAPRPICPSSATRPRWFSSPIARRRLPRPPPAPSVADHPRRRARARAGRRPPTAPPGSPPSNASLAATAAHTHPTPGLVP